MSEDAELSSRERAWPRCGASAAIFRNDEVLLIERAKGALKGRWSLPGGHVEPGETAKAAALREVR
jgi:8-oxo-dGTP diphosphatase